MKEINGPTTLLEAIKYFADEDVCIRTLSAIRWPDGVIPCPACGNTNHYYLAARKIWKCKACSKQFSIKVGTIFEDSPIKLSKWLPAMWMICGAKNGISSYELHRALGVTQKTGWFMLHRIRLAMKADLPTNPEFQRFAAFTGAIVTVPKAEIDRLLAEEREAKECEGDEETVDAPLMV